MYFEGRLASGPEEICDLFVEFIQRTYTDDVWVSSDPGPEFTSDEVESVLQDLGINKGSGPDGIAPIILKNCASAFAKPLSFFFNRYMATSVFPDRWKVSHITPISKKGRRKNVEYYRGMEILSAIPKHFDLLIYRGMYSINMAS
jgi:hypothetical protein